MDDHRHGKKIKIVFTVHTTTRASRIKPSSAQTAITMSHIVSDMRVGLHSPDLVSRLRQITGHYDGITRLLASVTAAALPVSPVTLGIFAIVNYFYATYVVAGTDAVNTAYDDVSMRSTVYSLVPTFVISFLVHYYVVFRRIR
jgi:hypothetical protein